MKGQDYQDPQGDVTGKITLSVKPSKSTAATFISPTR